MVEEEGSPSSLLEAQPTNNTAIAVITIVLISHPSYTAALHRLKVTLNTLIILRLLRLAGPVGRGYVGQFPSPRKRFKGNPTRNTVN